MNSKLLSFVVLNFSLISFSWGGSDRLMSVEKVPESASYFDVKVSDSGTLRGEFEGWCADWLTTIDESTPYSSQFYSSYTDLPEGLMDHPENLDQVNWILNQDFVGKHSPLGIYTKGDIQLAIWSLVDNYYETSSVGPFSQARVDFVVQAAKSQGVGFYPRCREFVGMILIPVHLGSGQRVQTVIIKVPRWRFPKCVIPTTDVNDN